MTCTPAKTRSGTFSKPFLLNRQSKTTTTIKSQGDLGPWSLTGTKQDETVPACSVGLLLGSGRVVGGPLDFLRVSLPTYTVQSGRQQVSGVSGGVGVTPCFLGRGVDRGVEGRDDGEWEVEVESGGGKDRRWKVGGQWRGRKWGIGLGVRGMKTRDPHYGRLVSGVSRLTRKDGIGSLLRIKLIRRHFGTPRDGFLLCVKIVISRCF